MTTKRQGFNQVASGLAALAILLLARSASANTITFATGDFTPAEWSSNIWPGSTGTSTAFTEATGGNPGAYRRVSLTVDVFQSVLNSQLWSVAQFTPAAQGSVSSASLSYDITRVFTDDPGATQVVAGVSLEQDGVIYFQFIGISTASPPTWDPIAVANLVPLFPAINWVNGNAITFGFYDSVSSSTEGFTIDGGYDNYAVTVNYTPLTSTVPEPASLLLVASGLVGLARMKHRRSR